MTIFSVKVNERLKERPVDLALNKGKKLVVKAVPLQDVGTSNGALNLPYGSDSDEEE